MLFDHPRLSPHPPISLFALIGGGRERMGRSLARAREESDPSLWPRIDERHKAHEFSYYFLYSISKAAGKQEAKIGFCPSVQYQESLKFRAYLHLIEFMHRTVITVTKLCSCHFPAE